MARRPAGSGSYTVVIIPLRTSLNSLDALHFYLWIKHLKDLEREKDALWSGLQILERTRLWYHQQLEQNRTLQDNIESRNGPLNHLRAVKTWSSQLRSQIQRVNGSLGCVMTEPNVTSCCSPSLPEAMTDSVLRWRNTVLTKEVSDRNYQISMLEMEKDALLEQIDELQAH